jgi:predicted SAM-dependent methyltransferase/dTDP-4-dehydrorhamnose 3,5-epimerase-like enzyme
MKLTTRQVTINDSSLIKLNQHIAEEGVLTIAEYQKNIPFKIERAFFIKPTKENIVRGNHSHKSLSQFMICINGSVEIIIDDSINKKTILLDNSKEGLLVPPDIFSWQKYLSKDAILLVLCDKEYNEKDYIRDYSEFKKYIENKTKVLQTEIIKLNLGCGGRPLEGYINVDMDSLEEIRTRYPNRNYDDSIVVVDYDLFDLPFMNNSVDEIRSEALIEHLPFIEEPKFFKEVVRVLKPGGLLYLTTVDFEKACEKWLVSDDNWLEFYRDDKEAIKNEHWFGTNSYKANNRWGYLTATFYGSQNGAGQFHTNCYSENKFKAICKYLNLEVKKIEKFKWQGDRDDMIALTAIKLDSKL